MPIDVVFIDHDLALAPKKDEQGRLQNSQGGAGKVKNDDIPNPLGEAYRNTLELNRQAYLYDKVGFANPEEMVRGFTSVESLPKPREVPVPPDFLRPDAFIAWGKPSTFSTADFRADALNFLNVSYTDEPTDPEPDKRVRYTYSEEGRTYHDIRVVHSDDADQYIVVREQVRLAMDGPDGQLLIDGAGPKSPGDVQERGQDPPAPPDLDHMGENEDWLAWWGRHHLGPPP